ncbi:MAG: DUF1573 domain-containing protein [Planctomycetales bacterium]|nr:DUF1573 domain-containing protein [Planctomycetales bacterium]
MKITILAIFALAIGIALGMYSTHREFEGERLPTKMMLAVLEERETKIPTDGPKVIVEGGEIFDFGTMDSGSKGNHPFVFRNVGNKPLVVTMGETTCKCTAMSVDGLAMIKGSKRTILPGESFKVTLDWVIKQTTPSFSQSAEFETTDPRRSIVRLLIHGRTVEAIEMSPPTLEITGVTSEEPAAGEVAIYSHREQELKIVKHDWEASELKDYFEATFSPISATEARAKGAKGGITMRVQVKPGLPLGVTRQAISLSTNYEGIAPQVIPVIVKVVGDISLLGAKIPSGTTVVNLGDVDQKVGTSHTVYLHIKGPHRDLTEIEIERVEPAGSLTATLEPSVAISPTVKRVPLKMEIPAGAPLGNYAGTNNSQTGLIYLKTTHPKIKQMVVPVLFVVR